jgi:arabinofuranan 3-O-arabinosyltransferase
MLELRDEWLDGREPTAQVSVDGRSRLALVRADGSVTIPPLRGKVVTVRLLLGPSDPEGAASLEVAGLSIEGVRQAKPGVMLSAGCGSGPRLLVDGVVIPTTVQGARSAAYGTSRLDWSACAPLELRGSTGRVVVEQWRGFVPDRMLLDASAARPTTEGKRTLTTIASGPESLRLDVSGGAASIVSLTQNANPGWRATLGGKALPPVVVDGWRQGFILPAGKAGPVDVEFGPGRLYRAGLLAGLVLALALVAAAIAGSGGRTGVRAAARLPRWAGAAAAMGFGVLLAGAAGALVALGAVGLAWQLRERRVVQAGVAAALLIGAACAQSWISPGSVGGSTLEGSVRLACLAAVALVSAAGSFDGEPTSSADAPGSGG